MSIDYTQSQTSARTGYIFNYQPVRPRGVFRGELKQAFLALLTPNPRLWIARGGGSLCWLANQLDFGSVLIFNVLSGTLKQ